jgi:hypothetical protein
MRMPATGIEAVGRLVEDDDPGSVNDGLGQLHQLFHAGGEATDLTVAGFTEPDEEQRLVGTLQRFVGGQAGEFGHVSHHPHRRHVADEGVMFWHVAHRGAQGRTGSAHRCRRNPALPGSRPVDAHERPDEGRFAGAVGTQQADGLCAAVHRRQLVEDLLAAES